MRTPSKKQAGVARRSAAIAGIGVLAMVASGLGSGVSGASSKHHKNSHSNAPHTIVIGATMPLTGSGAPFGKQLTTAMDAAVKHINHHGGVDGSNLKIDELTDKALAAPAVLDTQQLISSNHAVAIITSYDDPPLAQYKIGKKTHVPIINAGGNTPTIANKPYLWDVASLFTNEEVVAFNYEKAHGVKSVGSLAATNYTNAAISHFHKVANKIFGGTQKLVTFTPTSTNVSSQLEELRSSHPTIISPLCSGTIPLTVAEDMHNLGMKDKVAGIDGMFTVPATLLHEPAWTGAVAGVPVAPPAPWLNKATKAQTGHTATQYSSYAADSVFVVKDAVAHLEKHHRAVNGRNINDFLKHAAKKGTALRGSKGKITFRRNHVLKLSYTVSQIDNGKVKVLKTLTPAHVAKEAKKAGA